LTARLPLGRVVAFATIAECMSFSRAAETLRVDQSWLSRQIRQLETQLGFTLFVRTTRAVALTAEGERFLPAARRLADAAAAADGAARAIVTASEATLRVGASSFSYWVPVRHAIFRAMEAGHRTIEMQWHSASTDALLASLADERIDVAIVMLCRDMHRIDYMPVYRARPHLMIPVEDPLAERDAIVMADLRGLRLALPLQTIPRTYDNEHGPFLDAGVDVRWVEEGRMGVHHYAILERICALAYVDQYAGLSDYVIRPILDTRAQIEFGVVRKIGDERSAVRKFWQIAKAAAQLL